MIARTGFPEYLQSIAIGPDIEFLKTNTSLCDVANTYTVELNLAYKWRNVTTSRSILPELRSFVKNFVANGPDLDTETLIFFINKYNNTLPNYVINQINNEVTNAFIIAENYTPIPDYISDFSTEQVDNDKNFLGRLSDLLKGCNSPCNYFRAYGDSIGTVFDISRNNNTNTEPGGVDETRPPATHAGMNILNKIAPAIRASYLEMCTRAGMVWDAIKEGKPSPKVTDTSSYTSVNNVYADAMSKVKRRTQDCFRLYDYNNRYNAYDPAMNLANARRKSLTISLMGIGEHTVALDGDTGAPRKIEPATKFLVSRDNDRYTDRAVIPKNAVTGSLKNGQTSAKDSVRMTTYGLYDPLMPGHLDTYNSHYGIGGGTSEGSILLNDKVVNGVTYTPAALSPDAASSLGLSPKTSYGTTFTLTTSDGTVKNLYYADTSSTFDKPTIDAYDGTSTSIRASSTSGPFSDISTNNSTNKSDMKITVGEKVALDYASPAYVKFVSGLYNSGVSTPVPVPSSIQKQR